MDGEGDIAGERSVPAPEPFDLSDEKGGVAVLFEVAAVDEVAVGDQDRTGDLTERHPDMSLR